MSNPSDPTGPHVVRGRSFSRTVNIDGERWVVYERQPDAFDRRAGPSLIFESDNTVRRVRHYPANWHELTDDALGDLRHAR